MLSHPYSSSPTNLLTYHIDYLYFYYLRILFKKKVILSVELDFYSICAHKKILKIALKALQILFAKGKQK